MASPEYSESRDVTISGHSVVRFIQNATVCLYPVHTPHTAPSRMVHDSTSSIMYTVNSAES